MAEFMDHVEALADQIGPRPVSTEEERQAAMYIAQELTDLGLEVNVDEFATPTGVRWPYAIAFALVIAGTILSGLGMFIEGASTPFFVVGLVLAIAGFAIYYTERNNMAFLSSRRAGGVSQNVVAKYVPSSVARERNRRKIIIAAHVDTVRAEPQAMPAIINRLPLVRRILFYVMIALPALVFVRLLPIPWPDVVDLVLWVISLIGCVLVLAALGCVVASRFMPYVSGGNDNASAAAVMLSVAARLLDPAERERYTREKHEMDLEVPVETFAPQITGSFEPVGAEDVSIHDAQEAEEAGVVPEGAEIEYAQEAGVGKAEGAEVISLFGDAASDVPELDLSSTVAMPPVWEQEGEDADAEADADEALTDEERAFVSELEVEGAEEQVVVRVADADAEFADEPELEPELEHELEPEQELEPAQEPEPEEAGSAGGAEVAADAESAAQDELPEVHVPENVPAGGAWPDPSEYEEVPDEPEAPSVYDMLREEPEPQPRPAVPSWYTAAREKAAKDKAAREAETEAHEGAAGAEPEGVSQEGAPEELAQEEQPQYRSRFADMPLRSARQQVVEEPEPEPEPEPAPAPRRRLVNLRTGEDIVEDAPQADAAQADAPAAGQAVEAEVADADASGAAADANGAEETPRAAQAEQAPAPKRKRTPFKLDIADDDLEDISPDLTGNFTPLDEKRSSVLEGLTTRIPTIGSSDGTSRTEGAAEPDQEEKAPAGREARKSGRRRPTARRATEEFQPTRVSDSREAIEAGSTRQVAAVTSTYEDTPQAAPRQRTEAQRTERPESARPTARSSQPGLSGTIPSARTAPSTPSSSPNPGSTSSFPALTGSFPALTGSFPAVNSDAFSTSTGGDFLAPRQDEFAAAAPSQTGTIDIPESRFHNAVDNVGGLFSRLGRKGKDTRRDDEFGTGDAEEWNEDDDFGWKGGGYFNDEEGLGDAARRRAAEIRESVISMTESDLLDKEVWFVALGASNAGGQGMKNFLDLHRSELRGSLIINLESVGAGEICYADYEGQGKLNRADRRLMSLIKRASREMGGKEMKARTIDYRNTDATYAMLSGMRAISVMGFDGVAPEGWHWSTDTSDIVNPDKLDYVSRLLMRVIENS